MSSFKAAIFDADGVLIDSLEPHLQIARDLGQEFHIETTVPSSRASRRSLTSSALSSADFGATAAHRRIQRTLSFALSVAPDPRVGRQTSPQLARGPSLWCTHKRVGSPRWYGDAWSIKKWPQEAVVIAVSHEHSIEVARAAQVGDYCRTDKSHGRMTETAAHPLPLRAHLIGRRWHGAQLRYLVAVTRQTLNIKTQELSCETACYITNAARDAVSHTAHLADGRAPRTLVGGDQ